MKRPIDTTRAAVLGLGLALLTTLAACAEGETPTPVPTPVAKVVVAPDTINLTVGGQRTLTATLRGTGGQILEGRSVAWTSSNEAVAAVSATGRVTAVAEGTARIRATSEGQADSATVTVLPVVEPVGSVEIEGAEEVTVDVGSTLQFAATARAADGSALADRVIGWSTASTAVATVSEDGLFTALAAGETILRAESEGKRDSVRVTVRAPVASVEIQGDGVITLEVGVSMQLTAVTRGADGSELHGRTILWSSASTAVASVSPEGVVTARRAGRTVVTAASEAKTGSIEVIVPERYPFHLVYDELTAYVPGMGNVSEIHRLPIDPAGAQPVRLFGHPQVWDASPSPDGQRIAFTCVHGSGTQICVAGPNDTLVMVLTDGASHADQPAWSPDGTKIAFRRWPHGATPGEFNPTRIWVMNADGTGQTNLTEGAEPGSWQETPTWSPRQPDGSYRIAYSHQTRSGAYVVGRIHSMRGDGTDKRAVTTGGEYLEREPAWSPDGGTIVFVRTGGTAFGDLWRADPNGGGERQLMANDPADDQRSPAWSPDGLYLAFTSKHEPSADGRWSYQIYTVRADGTGMTRRTHTGVDKENPGWIAR